MSDRKGKLTNKGQFRHYKTPPTCLISFSIQKKTTHSDTHTHTQCYLQHTLYLQFRVPNFPPKKWTLIHGSLLVFLTLHVVTILDPVRIIIIINFNFN